jgi:RNA polymerase sigma-70 factor (ECF subfamily)
MKNAADRELVERMRAGDQSAVSDLATGYGSRILQLALRYARNREDAEEIAQDVLLKVYRNIDTFRGDSALSSWIYRITFNTAMSRLRTGRLHSLEFTDECAGARLAEERTRAAGQADWSSLADDELLRAQLRARLVKALRDLPPIYRLPVLLRDVQGLSTEEASAVLRVKDQTLKSRLHRGRLILRDQLSDFAGGLSLHRAAAVATPARVEPETRH